MTPKHFFQLSYVGRHGGSIGEAIGFSSRTTLRVVLAKSQSDFDGAASRLLQKLPANSTASYPLGRIKPHLCSSLRRVEKKSSSGELLFAFFISLAARHSFSSRGKRIKNAIGFYLFKIAEKLGKGFFLLCFLSMTIGVLISIFASTVQRITRIYIPNTA